MFIVEIVGTRLEETQQWWQDFVDHVYDIHGDVSDTTFDRLITKELKKYKAKMVINPVNDDLDALAFVDEKYYTAFLLQWA